MNENIGQILDRNKIQCQCEDEKKFTESGPAGCDQKKSKIREFFILISFLDCS
jgi:hypothetical protein